MSLILEALRKLEREKARNTPSIITAGEAPWSEARRSLPAWALVAAGIVLVTLGAVVGARFLGSGPKERAGSTEPPVHPTAAAPAVTKTPAIVAGVEAPRPVPVPLPTSQPAASTVPAARPAASRTVLPRRAGPVRGDANPVPGAPAPRRGTPAHGLQAAPEPRLQAISVRDGKPIAMIDDHVFFEGDKAGELHVIRIGDGEVEVEWRGVRRMLKF